MLFDNLRNSIAIASCGLCCSKDSLCENCEKSTLRANGLPESFQSEIHGLNHHGNFSQLYVKLNDLIKLCVVAK